MIKNPLALNTKTCGKLISPQDGFFDSWESLVYPYWRISRNEGTTFDTTDGEAVFESFEIRRYTDHNASGSTPQGHSHDWHLYRLLPKNLTSGGSGRLCRRFDCR